MCGQSVRICTFCARGVMATENNKCNNKTATQPKKTKHQMRWQSKKKEQQKRATHVLEAVVNVGARTTEQQKEQHKILVLAKLRLVWCGVALGGGGLWCVCGCGLPEAYDHDKTTNGNGFWTHGQTTVCDHQNITEYVAVHGAACSVSTSVCVVGVVCRCVVGCGCGCHC